MAPKPGGRKAATPSSRTLWRPVAAAGRGAATKAAVLRRPAAKAAPLLRGPAAAGSGPAATAAAGGPKAAVLGASERALGSPGLGALRDSTSLLQEAAFGDLRARLREDGYLFLRGLLPADAVDAARRQAGLRRVGKPKCNCLNSNNSN